jgi:hypothetical protein
VFAVFDIGTEVTAQQDRNTATQQNSTTTNQQLGCCFG